MTGCNVFPFFAALLEWVEEKPSRTFTSHALAINTGNVELTASAWDFIANTGDAWLAV